MAYAAVDSVSFSLRDNKSLHLSTSVSYANLLLVSSIDADFPRWVCIQSQCSAELGSLFSSDDAEFQPYSES
jgi:hypothetical protein